MSEKYNRKQMFAAKDSTLKFILNTYKKLALTDADLVNLAKYFSHYSRFDWAKTILEPRLRALDVSEDLVYYYVTLTIFDDELIIKPEYRTILVNAINANPSRFCRLFNSINQDGVTFQLLVNPFLKQNYCETCK